MKKICALGLVGLSSVLCPLSSLHAQAPSLINYQGRLLNGANLVNGTVGLSLRLFSVAGGGTALYEDSNSVTVVDGLYSTFLGDNTTSGSLATALTNGTLFLETMVNGAALAPRERLAAAAYAVHSWGLSGNAGTTPAHTSSARRTGGRWSCGRAAWGLARPARGRTCMCPVARYSEARSLRVPALRRIS